MVGVVEGLLVRVSGMQTVWKSWMRPRRNKRRWIRKKRRTR